MLLRFHHVGCLVRDLDHAIERYKALFPVSRIWHISAQKVRVCFVDTGCGSAIELIQAADGNATVQGLLKRGVGYYHVGYLVKNFESALTFLDSLGFKQLDSFRSEAFNNRRCAFLMSPVAHLIEIIEAPVGEDEDILSAK